jgi:hypothetical protein
VHFDPDAKPTDYDCYSRGQVEAWERDEWRYVGVVLSVSVGDTEIEPHAVSLWGIECNFPGSDKNAHLTACANDLLDEALTEAREKVEQLLKALQAAREGLSNEQTKS